MSDVTDRDCIEPGCGGDLDRAAGRCDRVHAAACGRSNDTRARSTAGRAAHPSRWSLTSPIACMNAYTVVGPTNRHPRRLSSRASAVDSGVCASSASPARSSRRPRAGRARSPTRTRPASPPPRPARPRAGVVDHGLDLAAVADDRGVAEQPRRRQRSPKPRDPLEVEARECAAERLALAKDRQPGEARLEAFEAQLLEQADVIGDRVAPLSVVVGAVLRRRRAPPASGDAVVSAHDPVVGHAAVCRSGDGAPAR